MNHIEQWQREQEKILESFVNSRTGIVKNLYELTREPDAPDIFFYISEIGNIRQFHFQQCGNISTGIGITRFHAKTAAIGEALERYSASFYNPETIVFTSYEQMISKGFHTVHPKTFALYSEKQYQQYPYLNRFDENTPVGWTKGVSLTEHSREIWIPACFVFLPYQYLPGEIQVATQISTGLACSFDSDTAFMSGICEIIEREAVMVAWLHGISGMKIRIDESDWFSEVFQQRFLRSGFQYALVEIPNDLGLHIVFALMIDKGRGIVSTGSSAKHDLKQAALKALLETAQVRELLKSLAPAENPRFHLEIYQDISLSENIRNLFYSGELLSSDQAQPSISFEKLLENCKQAGLDVYAAELTTRELADEGLKVVRIVIPQAVRLCREFEIPYLGGQRLYHLPEKLGLKRLAEKNLYLKPHPFG